MSESTVEAPAPREPVLSPVDRISEMLFGLLMALSFVGAVSVADTGQAEIRELFIAAFGCNLAWGLVDAVMYVVRVVTDRGRALTLAHSVKAAPDAQAGRALIERSLSRVVAGLVSPAEVEAIRGRIVALPVPRAAPSSVGRPDCGCGGIPACGGGHLSRRSAFRADAGCGHGKERVARHRGGHAFLRWTRSWAVRGLWELEDRFHR